MIIRNLEKEPIEITISRWVFAKHDPDDVPLMKFLVGHNQLHVSMGGPESFVAFTKGEAMVVEGTGAWTLVNEPFRAPGNGETP